MDINKPVRLKKILSTHNNLRTDEVIGYLVNPIELGHSIVLIAKSLDLNKDARYVTTTSVQKIEGNRYFTKNSIYEITQVDSGILYGRTIP